MRRDGDVLIEHLRGAKSEVLLCAPFIKAAVLKKLLVHVAADVPVRVITRWHPEEVAAGVSDLGVFDVVVGRPGTTLALLDRLHAKIYTSDAKVLIGSANLTATALGWCDRPNLEILTEVPADDPSVVECLSQVQHARVATEEERVRVQAEADQIKKVKLPASEDVDDAQTGLWLPKFAAPRKLYLAYVTKFRDRLAESSLPAADHDLNALDLQPGLSEASFKEIVGTRFLAMPSMSGIAQAAAADLTDAEAVKLVSAVDAGNGMDPDTQWLIVREWMTFFLEDRYEIAPQSFIVRERSGFFSR